MRTTILVSANKTAQFNELFKRLRHEPRGRDLIAVLDAYDPTRHDEIIVSTLSASVSHWTGIDLRARVARRTNALVSDVQVPEPRPAASRA